MIENIHLTMTDVRPLYCSKGAHKAFKASGLDTKHFIDNGAMSHDLLGYGFDAIIERVVRAKLEAERGRRG